VGASVSFDREEHVRRALALFIAIALSAPASAATLGQSTSDSQAGLKFIKNYRTKPDPDAVPAIMHALSQQGSFRDPDSAGVYTGFLAGVLASNPKKARSLLAKVLPLPFAEQWLVIRALAYSELPDWERHMRYLSGRLPDRRVLIEHYLTGQLPTLDKVALAPQQPTTMTKVKGFFTGEAFKRKRAPKPEVTFATSPDLIDTLWGIYFATGNDNPVWQIVLLLPWSTDRDDAEKLTVGSMAKFTLAANAAGDAPLLALLRRLAPSQSKAVRPVLKEVIEAAETVDTARIGKEALAALEELKKKGPAYKREYAWWGQAGQVAISLGCVGAAVAGQVEFGIPCVVGGATSTAALRYFSSPE
jgi:hypothetical protein